MDNFSNIIGYKEEKNELISLCTLIKKRKELKKAGGKLPHGLYLAGPNGTGKTALAKAFINESKCEMVSINYNDLERDDDFVSYVKAKFSEAVCKAPCILFIDELDKLIGVDDYYFMSDNFDKSKAILNEINKYSTVEGLFLLFVSNVDYRIDPSIIRSGRIDKTIKIHLPNETERYEIIKYYLKDKNIDKNIKINQLAKLTNGCSGADIESLINNAVIKAFVDNRKSITNDDITSVFYDMVFNCKGKNTNLEDESQKQLCYHEAGHSTILLLHNPDLLPFVTILSRSNVKGFAYKMESDKSLETIAEQKQKMVIAFGGLVAEELFLNKRTMGSSVDLKKAKELAMDLVRHHGVCGFDKLSEPCSSGIQPSFSDDFLRKREQAEASLLNEAYNSAKEIISTHKDLVERIADALFEFKSLNEEKLKEIYQEYLKSHKFALDIKNTKQLNEYI